MMEILEGENIHFKDVYIDKSYAAEGLPTRKPGTGMLTKYLDGKYDLTNSFVIGDRYTDVQLAKNLGAKGILIGRSKDTSDDDLLNYEELKDFIALNSSHWKEIYQFLKNPNRKVKLERSTNETQIKIKLNLDGEGKAEIKTGLGFFDHMLEQ